MRNSRSLEELNILFREKGEKKLAAQKMEFLLDPEYKKTLTLILAYMTTDPFYESKKGSFRKGLFLTGTNGTGKTTIFKILQKLGLQKLIMYFPMISCTEVVAKYNAGPRKEDIITHYSFGNFCFDDLGKEPIASNYGTEDIFIRILENRYREFCEKGTKTFITTNLNLEQIGRRYGVHIKDRFYEMFNFHELNSGSFR